MLLKIVDNYMRLWLYYKYILYILQYLNAEIFIF